MIFMVKSMVSCRFPLSQTIEYGVFLDLPHCTYAERGHRGHRICCFGNWSIHRWMPQPIGQ